jgi:hypothetical protein
MLVVNIPVMSTTRFMMVAALFALAVTAPAHAAPHTSNKLLCKQVRNAVWAGHTLEQLTVEFGTDAQHIMKCLKSGKGKKPQAKKERKKAPAGTHEAKKK